MNKIILEVEKLAMEEESLKCELNRIKTELFFREDNLNKLKSDNNILMNKKTNLDKSHDEIRCHVDCLKSNLETTRTSTMLNSLLKKFIEKNEPTMEHQIDKINMFKDGYARMLSKYEDSPIYNSILQAEAEERNLCQLITEKRNDIMKLETQQEY